MATEGSEQDDYPKVDHIDPTCDMKNLLDDM